MSGRPTSPWPEPVATLAGSLLVRCSFPPRGTATTCAVSGGADSLALLALASRAVGTVTAVHVDHGLRTGSEVEADVVAAAAERFGARFRSERVCIPPGPNLEARARAARHAVLPADALTGHTADDQAETVLMNLLRGAGLDGLCGMGPGRHPLLALRRADTRQLCEALELHPVDDPTNDDAVHLRNRVRHELLPFLDDLVARDVAGVLSRQAALLRDDAELLDALAAAIDPTDAKALALAPAPLARRAVRRLLAQDHPPDGATVERVLAVSRGEVIACEVTGGRRVERHRGRISVAPAPGQRPPVPLGDEA